jgi:hypothetical protein
MRNGFCLSTSRTFPAEAERVPAPVYSITFARAAASAALSAASRFPVHGHGRGEQTFKVVDPLSGRLLGARRHRATSRTHRRVNEQVTQLCYAGTPAPFRRHQNAK